MDEKKKLPDEEEKKTPDTHEEKKDEPKAEEKPADKADENPADKEQPAVDDSQADENGEGADKSAEDKQAYQPNEDKSDKQDNAENAPDDKDLEILRLKTQIAAMQLGIKPDCIEDAVAVAESYVRNGSQQDINAALSAVVKKYPDMKGEGGKKSDCKKQGGFKVGAGSSDTDEKKPQSKPTAQKRWNKFK
jgi:hypothetical protein